MMDRLDELFTAVEAGWPMPEIGRRLNPDKPLSRQRVLQLLKRHNVHDLWLTTSRERAAKEREVLARERVNKTLLGQALLRFIDQARERGHDCVVEGTLTATVDGCPIAMHAPTFEFPMERCTYYLVRVYPARLHCLHVVELPKTKRLLFYSPGLLETGAYIRSELDDPNNTEASFQWPNFREMAAESARVLRRRKRRRANGTRH